MKKIIILFTTLSIIFNFYAFSKPDKKNKIKYKKYQQDQVLKKITEKRKEIQKKKEKKTNNIIERQKNDKKIQVKERRILKSDLSGVYPPKSTESFKSYFHFPPIPQYYTSTCWSFAATSFYESEIYRLTEKKIKLSDMWTPYWEYIEKAMRYIRERSKSYVSGGAQFNSIKRIWKKYGIVPAESYSGLVKSENKHDHVMLVKELKSYLNFVKKNNQWNEKDNRKHIVLIVNKYLGKPPEKIEYNGKTMTPIEFLRNEVGLNFDDYYSIMSTGYFPFYTFQEFKYPDNWWHSKEYINIPLNTWYKVIKKSIKSGYTIAIGGDTSEPGNLGTNDIAFIPTFDIPEKYINQDSREYRIFNKTTNDDHGIHLVGYTRIKGKDWFLIKDSNRSSRKGKYKGYYFFREDFIKLKMLSFTVHKDMLKDILPRIKEYSEK